MEEEIEQIVNILNNSGVIIYPTDTIWGLGCKATDSKAILKLKEIKERQEGKSLILLMSDLSMLKRYVTNLPQQALTLMSKTTTPLTIIYPKAKELPITLLSQDQSIGVRIPSFDFCTQLIKKLDAPLVSTSANISGENSPTSFADISEKLKQRVDYIVPSRFERRTHGSASSIYKITDEGQTIKIR